MNYVKTKIAEKIHVPELVETVRVQSTRQLKVVEEKFPYVHQTLPKHNMTDKQKKKLLKKIERLAKWLDNAVPHSPIPLGVDSILGFIPIIGGAMGSICSLYQIYLSTTFGIPLWLLMHMLFNILVDFVFSLIPVIGGFLHMFYKANIYNYEELNEWVNDENSQKEEQQEISWRQLGNDIYNVMPIDQLLLDKSTIRNIHSGQVIVDIESIAKELVENSLDASATFIELKFIDHGLHFIQVKDNGHGIEEKDRAFIAKHHYTSKIKSFQDLESIYTFGFRGEALHSICSISKNVSVTTKTKDDSISKKYDLSAEGNLIGEQTTNAFADSGTMISIHQPFLHLPVRRQVAQKNAVASVKKIQELLVKYALVYPSIRFAFHDASQTAGKPTVWIKPPTLDVESALTILYGSQLSDMLERFIETDPQHTSLTVDVILPKKNSDPSVILKGGERVFFYVNQRPIHYVKSELKELVTTIRNRYRESLGISEAVSAKKTPFIYIHIQLSPDEFDVNVEPNKTTILFHNKQRIINLIESLLDKLYPSKADVFFRQPLASNQPIAENVPQASSKRLGKENQMISAKNIMNWQISPSSQTSNDVLSIKQPESSRLSLSSTPITKQVPSSSHHTPKSGTLSNQSLLNIVSKPGSSSGNSLLNTIRKPSSSRSLFDMPKSSHHTSINDNTAKPAISNAHLSPSISNTTLKPMDHSPTSKAADATKSKLVPSSIVANSSSITSYFQKPTVQRPSPQPVIQQDTLEQQSMNQQHTLQQPSKSPEIQSEKLIPQKRTHTDFFPAESSRSTWNKVATIEVDMDSIRSNYAQRKEQMAKTYRMRIEDYIAIELAGEPFTRFITHSDQLIFFIKGIHPAEDERIHKVNQIGVLKYKDIQDYWIKNQFMSEPLISQTKLNRPVQVQFSTKDPLCSSLLSLTCRERLVKDDCHGQRDVTFKEITDERVTHNGFQVRWRKEPHLDCILVQFTSIYPLGSGYGPGDFRELLSNPGRRPTKVLNYLKCMAQEQTTHRTMDEEKLKQVLDKLQWQTTTGTEWKLGLLDSTIVACMLTV
ncbi:hypothetical protein G6F26_000033 [Rhizopus arrhizus]|uniref:DNA mismatch repair protein S5 domain-containing protein n=1 Tax=Rhizopus oryzae TaxID=64495 RepID=A0A9P6X675_RHIOR|nr:hypothetical protein G6F26_000033 [Rhizopus arrhizus]KAG1070313.1 hypothetical protein G6F41_005296 [Rhizopus arrhizus]KAG1306160.1 hypothetical protein G6F64_007813 [Rhizopus arrhizus]